MSRIILSLLALMFLFSCQGEGVVVSTDESEPDIQALVAFEPAGSLPFTLEAEDAVLDGVSIRSRHAGFTGSGYADYVGSSNVFIAWGVTTANATRTAIDVRYALGSSASRTVDVEVNGIVVDQLAFESTGGWGRWAIVSLEIDTIAGDNTIRLVASGQSGPNVDTISMRDVTPVTDTPATDTLTLPFTVEAEDTELSGVSLRSGNAGFSGTGYADYLDASDAFMAWDFNSSTDAVVEFDVRYALGASASRTLAIELNGDTVNQITFESTGSWTTWLNTSFTINVTSGLNNIRLIAIGNSGPNVDVITASVVSAGEPIPTFTVPFSAEAESLNRQSVPSVPSADASGGALADFNALSGAYIELGIESDSDVPASLELVYALGGEATRTLDLEVNGISVDQLTFTPTGSFTTFQPFPVTINLNAGFNRIRLLATGESGPNFDLFRASNTATGSEPLSYRVSTAEQVLFDTPITFLNHGFNSSQDWILRTIELTNVTDEPVTISSLTLDGPFSLQNPQLANGAEIDAGASLQIGVQFESDNLAIDLNNFIFHGNLQINSSDVAAPFFSIKLSGADLGRPDQRAEIPPAGMFEVMGIVADLSGFRPRASQIGGVGEDSPVVPGEATVNIDGVAQRALFFESENPSAPVRIQQLASMQAMVGLLAIANHARASEKYQNNQKYQPEVAHINSTLN